MPMTTKATSPQQSFHSGQGRMRHNSLRSAYASLGTYSASSLPSAPALQKQRLGAFRWNTQELGL